MDGIHLIQLFWSMVDSNPTLQPPPPPSGRPPFKRRTVLIALTAVLVVACIVAVIWVSNKPSPPTTSAPNKFYITSLDAQVRKQVIGGVDFGDALDVTINGETYSFHVYVYDPDGKQLGFSLANPDLNGKATVSIYIGSHKVGVYTIKLSRYMTEDYIKKIYIP